MAIPEPGTVLECAVHPCHNPAEQEVMLVGYGPYPTLVIKFCPSCVTIYKQKMFDWLHPYEDAIMRTHIDGHGAACTLEACKPYASDCSGVINYANNTFSAVSDDPPAAPSFITVALDGKELAHALTPSEAKQLRYPDYLSVAIDRVSDELLDRLEEDIRRIETHPASNAPEQHAPGWLPGDE